MKSVRISIEWNYGTTASLFAVVGVKKKYETARVATLYAIFVVATLFKNWHTCMWNSCGVVRTL